MNIIEWRNYLCEDELISSRAKHIGLTLSLFFREGKRTYPTIDTLCRWSSLAANTVSGALKDLQKGGYIEIKSYKLPNARFRGHEYLFSGMISNCNMGIKSAPPANLESTADAAIEPAIDAAIEPSNFEDKKEEIEEIEEKKEAVLKKPQLALQGKIKGTRLNENWELPEDWGDWALKEFDWDIPKVVNIMETFKDHWLAKAGADGIKLNWQSTWRNWCRRENEGVFKK